MIQKAEKNRATGIKNKLDTLQEKKTAWLEKITKQKATEKSCAAEAWRGVKADQAE